MIFVTVGSIFPFDRLIRSMDAWAEAHPDEEVFAQIGESTYRPAHMAFACRLTPADFAGKVKTARLTVAHAGTGSVVTASDMRKPIVILPRLAAQGEHTTNHQVDTANWLEGRPGIYVARDESELGACIKEALGAQIKGEMLRPAADAAFLKRIRAAVTS